jgi:hypothetical protein
MSRRQRSCTCRPCQCELCLAADSLVTQASTEGLDALWMGYATDMRHDTPDGPTLLHHNYILVTEP